MHAGRQLARAWLWGMLTAALWLAPAAASGAPPHELVPAYFAPEGTPNPWQTMCDRAPGSTAIVNPRNGPVKRQAKVYLEAMAYCHERGWRTIGYTFTRYGQRSLKAVEKAIDRYYLWYPTIDGIFLDEMAERPAAKVDSYYATLASYIRAKGGVVVGNPGDTAATPWQLAYVDQVVAFEGSAASFAAYNPAAWVAEAAPGQIADIVFAAQGQPAMQQACVAAARDNAGSVFVTDLSETPNPYATLPSYWASETEAC